MINPATTHQHVSEMALGKTPHKSTKLSNQINTDPVTKIKTKTLHTKQHTQEI